VASLIVLLLAVPSALSLGASEWFSKLPLFNIGFMDFIVIVFANYALVIGAFLIAVFVGYSWGIKPALGEIELYGNHFRMKKVWSFLIRYICPFAILSIMGYILVTGNYF
jgi:NSS family neurotransmitter:Na+ symporter